MPSTFLKAVREGLLRGLILGCRLDAVCGGAGGRKCVLPKSWRKSSGKPPSEPEVVIRVSSGGEGAARRLLFVQGGSSRR